MIRALLEVYSDYLIISSSQTTATGLSKVLGGQTSHDKITRFLSQEDWTSKDLREFVKPALRQCESDDGVLVDDERVAAGGVHHLDVRNAGDGGEHRARGTAVGRVVAV